MSGTYPDTPGPSDVELISKQPTLVRTAESGKRQARNAGGHLWEVVFNYPPLTRVEFEPINAFVMRQRGSSGEFQIVLPQKAIALGVATGSPVVSGVYAAGVSAVILTGFTVSITGILKAGDALKYAGHSKVYMCVEDADSDVAGNAVISFEPPLIKALALSEVVTVNNVPFTVYVVGVHKYKTRAPMLSTYTVRMIESL